MKKLWKLEWNIENETVGGLFIATDEEMQSLIGKEIHCGYSAGSISGLTVMVKDEEVHLVSDNLAVVETIEKYGENLLKFPFED